MKFEVTFDRFNNDAHEDKLCSLIDDEDFIVAEICGDAPDARKRAALFAAAPDLLEALKYLANEASGFKSMADPFTHGHTNMAVLGLRIDEARAAIAKAERGSHE